MTENITASGFITSKLSAERSIRIAESISEIDRILARALRYLPQFRDMELIEFCRNHLVDLHKMLEVHKKLEG